MVREALHVRSTRYKPDQVYAPHVHQETLFCVLLGGRYTERIHGRETEHSAGDVLVCPMNTPHSQRIGGTGAHKMLFGPAESTLAYLGELGLALDRAPAIRNEECAALGQRLANELGHHDPYSALAREGIAMELLAAFARCDAHIVERPGVPAWIRLARDYLHATLDAPGSLDDIGGPPSGPSGARIQAALWRNRRRLPTSIAHRACRRTVATRRPAPDGGCTRMRLCQPCESLPHFQGSLWHDAVGLSGDAARHVGSGHEIRGCALLAAAAQPPMGGAATFTAR